MITIVIASTNPVKARATLNGFQRVFPGVDFNVEAVAAPSNVAHQPMSDEETLRGALNRASNAMHARPQADYWIGMEGGIEVMDGELAVMAWIVVRSPTRIGKSRTGTFFLPPAVAELVRQGKELAGIHPVGEHRKDCTSKSVRRGIATRVAHSSISGRPIHRAVAVESSSLVWLSECPRSRKPRRQNDQTAHVNKIKSSAHHL